MPVTRNSPPSPIPMRVVNNLQLNISLSCPAAHFLDRHPRLFRLYLASYLPALNDLMGRGMNRPDPFLNR